MESSNAQDTNISPGQPVENVGEYPQDKSTTPDHPDVAQTRNPVDDNAVSPTGGNVVDNDQEPFSVRLIASAGNLAPSEVVPPDKVGAVLGALLLAHDNDGEVPAPLHERFDNVPNPNPES